jgi:hypothetical protein
LLALVEYDRLADSSFEVPAGTRSIVTRFKYPGGRSVAMTHHYHYPDGSTSPHDPNFVLVDADRWLPSHREVEVCPDCPVWRIVARESLQALEHPRD